MDIDEVREHQRPKRRFGSLRRMHHQILWELVYSGMLDGLSANFAARLANPDQAEVAALEVLTRMAEREAATMAFNDAFLVLGALFFLSLVLIPLLKSVSTANA